MLWAFIHSLWCCFKSNGSSRHKIVTKRWKNKLTLRQSQLYFKRWPFSKLIYYLPSHWFEIIKKQWLLEGLHCENELSGTWNSLEIKIIHHSEHLLLFQLRVHYSCHILNMVLGSKRHFSPNFSQFWHALFKMQYNSCWKSCFCWPPTV